jgi:2'-5' RNA ligase
MAENHKYEYGCLLVKLDIPKWDYLAKSFIKPEDLYTAEIGFGFEDNPHTTILFGFHDDETVPNKIKQLLKDQKEIEVVLDGITLFESEKYDVLKFDAHSDELSRLNKLMKDNFEYTNNFPNYHPHVTIAYVKAGEGKKYCGKLKKKVVYKSSNIVYSQKSGGIKTITTI